MTGARFYCSFLLFYCFNLFAAEPELNSEWLNSYFGDHKAIREELLNYSQKHLSEEHTTVWTTLVLQDGWGDLANLLNAIKIFKKKYPNWPMRAVIGVVHKFNEPIEERIKQIPFDFKDYDLKEDEVLILPYRNDWEISDYTPIYDGLIFRKLLNGEELEANDLPKLTSTLKIKNFVSFINTAELVINVSTYFPVLDEIKKPYIFLSEYGSPFINLMPLKLYEQIDAPNINKNIWAMGVAPSSAGIFILAPQIPNSFDNEILKKHFSGNATNFFNYKVPINDFIFALSVIYSKEKNMTIVSTEPLSRGRNELMKAAGKDVRVKIIKTEGEEVLTSPENYNREITILDAFPLSHSDFIRASSLASPPVGVTGNVSFSEVFPKLIYYYPANQSLKIFLAQIINLSKKALKNADDLIAYLELMSPNYYTPGYKEKQDRFIAKIQSSQQSWDNIEKAWKILTEIITEHFNVRNALLGLINMHFIKKSQASR